MTDRAEISYQGCVLRQMLSGAEHRWVLKDFIFGDDISVRVSAFLLASWPTRPHLWEDDVVCRVHGRHHTELILRMRLWDMVAGV